MTLSEFRNAARLAGLLVGIHLIAFPVVADAAKPTGPSGKRQANIECAAQQVDTPIWQASVVLSAALSFRSLYAKTPKGTSWGEWSKRFREYRTEYAALVGAAKPRLDAFANESDKDLAFMCKLNRNKAVAEFIDTGLGSAEAHQALTQAILADAPESDIKALVGNLFLSAYSEPSAYFKRERAKFDAIEVKHLDYRDAIGRLTELKLASRPQPTVIGLPALAELASRWEEKAKAFVP